MFEEEGAGEGRALKNTTKKSYERSRFNSPPSKVFIKISAMSGAEGLPKSRPFQVIEILFSFFSFCFSLLHFLIVLEVQPSTPPFLGIDATALQHCKFTFYARNVRPFLFVFMKYTKNIRNGRTHLTSR